MAQLHHSALVARPDDETLLRRVSQCCAKAVLDNDIEAAAKHQRSAVLPHCAERLSGLLRLQYELPTTTVRSDASDRVADATGAHARDLLLQVAAADVVHLSHVDDAPALFRAKLAWFEAVGEASLFVDTLLQHRARLPAQVQALLTERAANSTTMPTR